MSQNLPPVDEARLAAEWEADREVLANLKRNGDVARLARPVDVSFRGSEKDFERVLTIASQFGFVELDREEDEEGDLFLFLECVQPVDEASIRAAAARTSSRVRSAGDAADTLAVSPLTVEREPA